MNKKTYPAPALTVVVQPLSPTKAALAWLPHAQGLMFRVPLGAVETTCHMTVKGQWHDATLVVIQVEKAIEAATTPFAKNIHMGK